MSDEQTVEQQEDLPVPVTLEISRSDEANRIVSKYVGWSAGTGTIPFPVWDVAAVAAVQIKMLRDLHQLYDASFSQSKAHSIISVLLGSVSPHLLFGITAASLFKFVPGVGHVLAAFSLPLLASAATYAVGRVMVSHLENGGTISNLNPKAVKEKFQEAFEEGKAKLKSATAKKATTTPATT